MDLRRVAPALLIAIALLMSACGGGDDQKSKYEAGLKRMQGQLATANTASRESGETTEPAERRVALGRAHAALDKAAKTAADLDPPEDARAAHRKLVAALRDYADLFDRLARLEENDPSESELYSEAGTIVDRLEEANRALDKAGYSAGPSTKSDSDDE